MNAAAPLFATLGLLFVAWLIELAREEGVLLQSLAIAFLVLLALAIAGSTAWFHFVDLPRLNVHY